MITEKETFRLKNKILEEIAQRFEELVRTGELTDEGEANDIVSFVNEEIDPVIHPAQFTRAVKRFCSKFPAFATIESKLRAMRTELLQKIGQECLENLMGTDPERWSTLSEDLATHNEEDMGAWMQKLPEETYDQFTQQVFEPQNS